MFQGKKMITPLIFTRVKLLFVMTDKILLGEKEYWLMMTTFGLNKNILSPNCRKCSAVLGNLSPCMKLFWHSDHILLLESCLL